MTVLGKVSAAPGDGNKFPGKWDRWGILVLQLSLLTRCAVCIALKHAHVCLFNSWRVCVCVCALTWYIFSPRAPFESDSVDVCFRISRSIMCLKGCIITEEQMVLYWFIWWKINHDCSYGYGKCAVHTHCTYLFRGRKRKKEIHDSIEHHRLVIFSSLGISVGGIFLEFSL